MGIYIVKESGDTLPLQRHYCIDEVKELHDLIKRNHDILPGDQIDPENPRRWLLIKHEMPVVDPGSGSDRWSLDLFFLDQDAIPTFIECKRYKDTRSRREVVAQMIDYADNGQHYLDHDLMAKYAENSATKRQKNLSELFSNLNSGYAEIKEFFERAEQNLKDGRVRLIFLLEDSHHDLRSVVSFLNKQMTHTEVLIVELKFFVYNEIKVVSPSLFGYTEQAHALKKEIARKETSPKSIVSIDDETFLRALEKSSGETARLKAEELFNRLEEIGVTRTFTPKGLRLIAPIACECTILSLSIDGTMYVNVCGIDRKSRLFIAISEFAQNFRIQFEEDSHGRTIKPKDDWCNKIDFIVEFFSKINSECVDM